MNSLPSISDFTEFLNHNIKAAKTSATIGAKYGKMIASSVKSLLELKKKHCKKKHCFFLRFLPFLP